MSDTSDRKYRQHGYQDRTTRPQAPRADRPREPIDPRLPRDPRVPNMPGFREVFRCARCGNLEAQAVGPETACKKCGVALHACIQCSSFDPGASMECRQKIAARVSPKDARNECALFSPRLQVERETGSTPAASGSTSAKKAFDDLFKF